MRNPVKKNKINHIIRCMYVDSMEHVKNLVHTATRLEIILIKIYNKY